MIEKQGALKVSNGTITYDYRYQENAKNLIPVVFIHGFKGYKDWGAFNLVANEFANEGCFFLKFNFSHNGTTPDCLTNFADLDAFGNNNFSKELRDLDDVIEVVLGELSQSLDLDKNQLTLVAHSRGGATSFIKAAEDVRVKRVITWASVGTIEGRIPQIDLTEYERTGVIYFPNLRTNQQMPIYFQFVQDFLENKERYSLKARCKEVKVPVALFHGTADLTVPLEEAELLKNVIPYAVLNVVEGADHTFGAIEPWHQTELPRDLQKVVRMSIDFINKTKS